MYLILMSMKMNSISVTHLSSFPLAPTAILIEVFRSALSTVNKGQMEAAQSVGLTNSQAYSQIAVIPQALVVALPNICRSNSQFDKSYYFGICNVLTRDHFKGKSRSKCRI